MATHLRDKDITGICKILSTWPRGTKLSWAKLVDNVRYRLGIKTTRQTLQSYACITNALKKKKTRM